LGGPDLDRVAAVTGPAGAPTDDEARDCPSPTPDEVRHRALVETGRRSRAGLPVFDGRDVEGPLPLPVDFAGEIIVAGPSWRRGLWPVLGCAAPLIAAAVGGALGGVLGLGVSALAAWYAVLLVDTRIAR
jgi:hypothetical protein